MYIKSATCMTLRSPGLIIGILIVLLMAGVAPVLADKPAHSVKPAHAVKPVHGVKPAFKKDILIVAADLWCPYNCDPEAPAPGILIEILQKVFGSHGLKVEYRVMPWKRALMDAEAGKIDAAIGAVKGNHGKTIIGNESIGVDETVFVTRRSEGFVYNGTASLDGKSIGVISNYTYDNNGELDLYLTSREQAEQEIYKIYTDTALQSLFGMLLNGRIDVFPENRYVAAYMAETLGHADDVSIVSTGLGDNIYVAFSPGEKGEHLASVLDRGILELRGSGVMRSIHEKYGIP